MRLERQCCFRRS